jgi:hypothetical protein
MDSHNQEIADLRIRVEKLERIVASLTGQPFAAAEANLSAPAWESEVRALISAGRDIDAMKLVRQYTNGSLAEAQMRVEQMKASG